MVNIGAFVQRALDGVRIEIAIGAFLDAPGNVAIEGKGDIHVAVRMEGQAVLYSDSASACTSKSPVRSFMASAV